MGLTGLFLAYLMVYLCNANQGYKERIVNEVCSAIKDPACKAITRKCLPHHNHTAESRREWHTKRCQVLDACLNKIQGVKAVHQKYIQEHKDGKDWCSPATKMDYDRDYADHRDGHRDGPRDGQHDGHSDGHSDGPRDGQRDGERDGPRDGQRDGERDGQHDGERDGHRDGPRHEHRDEQRDGQRDEHGNVHQKRKIDFESYLAQASGAPIAAEFACCKAVGKGQFKADGKVNVDAWKKDVSNIEDPAARKAYQAGITACAASRLSCSKHDFKLCVVNKCYEATRSN